MCGLLKKLIQNIFSRNWANLGKGYPAVINEKIEHRKFPSASHGCQQLQWWSWVVSLIPYGQDILDFNRHKTEKIGMKTEKVPLKTFFVTGIYVTDYFAISFRTCLGLSGHIASFRSGRISIPLNGLIISLFCTGQIRWTHVI